MTSKRRSEIMEENRAKLITAAWKSFAERGFAAVSMDELTASVGLTRGALYHNFGDKKGLLAAVVAQVDGEIVSIPVNRTIHFQRSSGILIMSPEEIAMRKARFSRLLVQRTY